MPLVRFEVKNEYGLGDPELYRGPTKKDDPRALLDGVAVAGLVGILRQLGDLAEFAADVFHDLHEQVVATSSRGRKMMTRIQFIESKLPLLERAVQNQTSHIHFAYVAGTNWRANVHTDESHLLSSDLPRFIMDSYEECREPPRLYLLDKFDSSGPGACLKRYSDPSYFKRVCVIPQLARSEKAAREKKGHRNKRRGLRHRLGDNQHSISMPYHNVSRIASPGSDVQSFSTETTVTSDMRLKLEDASESTSFCSKARLNDVEQVLGNAKPSTLVDQQDYRSLPVSKLDINHSDPCTTVSHSESRDGADCSQSALVQEKNVSRLPSVTWDEKTEILEQTSSGSPERDHGDPSAFVSQSEQRDDVADDDGQQDSLQERIVNRLPSVTWDEKAEILKPVSPTSVDDILASQVESSDPSPVCLETLNFDDENSKLGRGHPSDREDILFDIANLPAPLSGGNHFDENNSETDNYMDALNTMESETEMDSDYQTKREVTPIPNYNYTKVDPGNGTTEQMAPSSSDSSDSDTAIGSHSSMTPDESLKLQNLEPLETSDHVESAHISGPTPNSDNNNGKDFSEHCPVVDLSRMNNSEVGDVDPSQGFVAPILPGNPSNGTMTNTSGGHGYPGGAINLAPVNFWTNGGLLGVEPSKPPDFSFPNVSNENTALGTISTGGYMSSHMETKELQNGESTSLATDSISGSLTKTTCSMGNIDKSFGIGTSIGQAYNVVQHDNSAVKQISHQPLQSPSVRALENYPGTHSHSHTGSSYPSKVDEFGSGDGLPAASNAESQASDSGPTIMSISSSISGLAHRFLANSLQRRTSLTDAESSGTSGIVNPVISKSQENFARNQSEVENFEVVSNVFNEQKTADKMHNRLSKKPLSYRYSEQSSPPLEEMKISFHPINQYEASKLKLDFSNRSFHEHCEDLDFPSFQLYPGLPVPVTDDISDSDDDTFCRSCPYSSEDLLSPRSYSNSELWDQDERDVDHEKSEESHRSSTSAASVSSHTGFEHINGRTLDPADVFVKLEEEGDGFSFQSSHIVDLPDFELIGFQKGPIQETCLSVDPEDPAPLSKNAVPPLPPLPPMQWRTTKPDFISVEDNSSVITEVDDHLDGLLSLKSTSDRDQEQNRDTESIANCNEKQHDEQKMNGKREANRVVHYEESDEKEDFLQQIRSKSFNLRRTETTRPSLIPQPTTNVNVAAILEKANAIRQACVGSDDGGDDDNWSDA